MMETPIEASFVNVRNIPLSSQL